jgi:uncharacterized protein
MARFDREGDSPGPIVQGFSNGGFMVDGNVFRGLLLTPQSAHEWDPPAAAALQPGHFDAITGLHPVPEFLLLGTGPRLVQPPRTLVRALEARGIGVEAMDSRAAARTWAVLRAEERWIVAALMPLG